MWHSSEFQMKGCGSLIALLLAAGCSLVSSSSVFWKARKNEPHSHPLGSLPYPYPCPWPQYVLCVFSVWSAFSSPDQACSRPHAVLLTAELACPVFPSAWRGFIRVVGSFCSAVLKSTLPLLDSLCSASALCSAKAVAVRADQRSLWLLYKFQQRTCIVPRELEIDNTPHPFFSGVGSL